MKVESGSPSRHRIDAKHTADLVLLMIRDDQLQILLVVRGTEPFKGRLALPGGFLRPREDLEQTARRELFEETGTKADQFPFLQLHTYSAPDRDPRERVITTAYLVIARDLPMPMSGTDARYADWVEFDESLRTQLAFDHWTIAETALNRIRSELEYTPIATSLCPAEFTMTQLRRVYELVWDTTLDAGNFRRKVLATKGFVEFAGSMRNNGDGGRPAALYRHGGATILSPPYRRPTRHRSPTAEPGH